MNHEPNAGHPDGVGQGTMGMTPSGEMSDFGNEVM